MAESCSPSWSPVLGCMVGAVCPPGIREQDHSSQCHLPPGDDEQFGVICSHPKGQRDLSLSLSLMFSKGTVTMTQT